MKTIITILAVFMTFCLAAQKDTITSTVTHNKSNKEVTLIQTEFIKGKEIYIKDVLKESQIDEEIKRIQSDTLNYNNYLRNAETQFEALKFEAKRASRQLTALEKRLNELIKLKAKL